MLNILDNITEWIKVFLIECITGNLSGMFEDVNNKVGEIAETVGWTPQDWNRDVFSMIQSLSETVIVPIAGMVITFVLCYELISMIIEKNNMHDIDTFMFYKWIFKTFVAVYLVTHTFDIVIAIFELSQRVVQQSAGVIGASASINLDAMLGGVTTQLEAMGMGELFGLLVETMLVRFAMQVVQACIFIVMYGRMIQIYIYCSIGSIPFATMTNREWGAMGNNYLRGLVALGLQGFFMMVCLAIYTILVGQIAGAANIHMAIWNCAGVTLLLCFSLFQTGNVAKSIFNAH